MMSEKVVLIVQARMGSVRLPGKSFMDLAGQPLVGRVLERLKPCRLVDEIVLAIPDTSKDDCLASLAAYHNVTLFRGSENDLLDRYVQAARQTKARYVCRLPADNPVSEASEIDRMIAAHRRNGYHFSSNLSEVFRNGYPDGIGVEVINIEVLEHAWATATDPEQREHVHLNFFNYKTQMPVNPNVRVGTVECPREFRRPDLILDVNTLDQYHYFKALYEALAPAKPYFGIRDIIQWHDTVWAKRKELYPLDMTA